MTIKDGAVVKVVWHDGFELDRAVLVDHTDDFRNVTVRTYRGGLMSGTVGSIEELKEVMFGNSGPCGGV